jgi:hypothetical protein
VPPLVFLLFVGLEKHWREFFLLFAVCSFGGLALACIAFVSVDDDMRALRNLLLGALSGLGIASWNSGLEMLRRYWNYLDDVPGEQDVVRLGRLFFFAIAVTLWSVVAGWRIVRSYLERTLVLEGNEIKRLLAARRTIDRPTLGRLAAGAPDDVPPNLLAKLVAVEDWSTLDVEEVVASAELLVQSKKYPQAMRAAAYAITVGEPPSQGAFEALCMAICQPKQDVVEATKRPVYMTPEEQRTYEAALTRMLAYYRESWLIHLCAGWATLFIEGKEDEAREHSEKARMLDPQQPYAYLNAASAIACKASRTGTLDAADETALLDYLRRYLSLYQGPDARPHLKNVDPDYDFVRAKSAQVAAFFDAL